MKRTLWVKNRAKMLSTKVKTLPFWDPLKRWKRFLKSRTKTGRKTNRGKSNPLLVRKVILFLNNLLFVCRGVIIRPKRPVVAFAIDFEDLDESSALGPSWDHWPDHFRPIQTRCLWEQESSSEWTLQQRESKKEQFAVPQLTQTHEWFELYEPSRLVGRRC